MVYGEGALLQSGSEVASGMGVVVGVEGGESVKRRQQIRRVRPRLQHLLQLPRQTWR